MRVKEFDFSFSHQLKKMKASCSIIKVREFHNVPMYRVAVEGEKNAEVFIFYKVDEEKKMFFWYPYGGQKELMAHGIAKALTLELK